MSRTVFSIAINDTLQVNDSFCSGATLDSKIKRKSIAWMLRTTAINLKPSVDATKSRQNYYLLIIIDYSITCYSIDCLNNQYIP